MDNERKAREGIRLTKEFIDLITKAIPVRKDTTRVLQEIATELENVNRGVNITKVVGYGVSILGGIATVTGIALSGGILAVFLVAGGVLGNGAGTISTIGSDIYRIKVSKRKLEKAQDALDKYKGVISSIEEIYDKLDEIATHLSKKLEKDKSEIFGSLFSNVIASEDDNLNILRKFGKLSLIYCQYQLLESTKLIQIGKDVTKMATMVTLKGVEEIALNLHFPGVFVLWDAIELVKTCMELSGGSKTEAATKLRKIADQLIQENENLEKILQEIRILSEQQIDTMMTEKMDKLLKKIADKMETESEDEKEFQCYAKRCTTDEWAIAYENFPRDTKRYILQRLALLYRFFLHKLDEYFDQKKRKTKHVVITLIAHGSIDTNPSSLLLPCSLFYPTRNLNDITFYQPWGYAIGADVVLGILNNAMIINDVAYIPEALTPNWHPVAWNSLPNTMTKTIFCPLFSPVRGDENAVQYVRALDNSLPSLTHGFVFLYTEEFRSMIRLDENTPLFLLTTALGLIGRFYDIDIDFRYAACLTPSHNNEKLQFMTQYHRYTGIVEPGQNSPQMVWKTVKNILSHVQNEIWQEAFDHLSKFKFG